MLRAIAEPEAVSRATPAPAPDASGCIIATNHTLKLTSLNDFKVLLLKACFPRHIPAEDARVTRFFSDRH